MGNRQAMRVQQATAAGEAAARTVLERCPRPSEVGLSDAPPASAAAAAIAAGLKPELIYFDGHGRGELCRLAFAAGGVDFIDTRVAQKDWPALKADAASVPGQCFGSLPCIRHGSHLIAQSRACAIYAAELGIWSQGRLGSNAAEEAVNGATEMMVLGAHADLQTAMYKCLFGDDASKAKGKESLPRVAEGILQGLEKILARKKTSGPFFFSESGPTLADLAVFDAIESRFPGLKMLGIDLTPYLMLSSLAEAVANDEVIANYLRSGTRAKPELIYFDGPGRGQLTRLAFAAGGVEFTDTRVPQGSWSTMKEDPQSVPSQCFGSLPCLRHGDMVLAQSMACATYAAQLGIWKQGRLGNTAEAPANRSIELMVLGACADLQTSMYKCLFGDDASKAKGKEDLPGSVTPILAGMERQLERKTSTGPFFFSQSGPTLADLAVYDAFESPFPGLKALGIDVAPYPKLSAVAAGVAADAKVKTYLGL